MLPTSSYNIAPKPPPPKYPDFSGYGWIIVICGFLLYLIVDGIAYNLGLINSEWLEEFQQSETATSWIGSIFYAVPLLSAPITAQLVENFGCKMVTIICGTISTAGFIISSFCVSIEQLYVTVGLVSGFGVSAAYIVGILSAERWFESHRTLAIGIVSSGTGFGTFLIAPITQRLLDAFGWRQTMLFLAGLFLLMSLVGCFIDEPQWLIEEMQSRGIRKKKKDKGCDNFGFLGQNEMNLGTWKRKLSIGGIEEQNFEFGCKNVNEVNQNEEVDEKSEDLNIKFEDSNLKSEYSNLKVEKVNQKDTKSHESHEKCQINSQKPEIHPKNPSNSSKYLPNYENWQQNHIKHSKNLSKVHKTSSTHDLVQQCKAIESRVHKKRLKSESNKSEIDIFASIAEYGWSISHEIFKQDCGNENDQEVTERSEKVGEMDQNIKGCGYLAIKSENNEQKSENQMQKEENHTNVDINEPNFDEKPANSHQSSIKVIQNQNFNQNSTKYEENLTNYEQIHSNVYQNQNPTNSSENLSNVYENTSNLHQNSTNVIQYQKFNQKSPNLHQNLTNSTQNIQLMNSSTQISPKSKLSHKPKPCISLKIPKILKKYLKIIKKVFSHFSNKNFTLLAISTFAIYALYNVPMFFIIELLRNYGYTEPQCANYLSVIGISLLVGMVTLGYIGDVSGDHVKNVNACCVLICGIAEALLPVCAENSIAFGVCCVIFGFTFASAYVLIPKITELIVGVEEFASAIGLNFFVQGLALLFGIPFASTIYELTGSWQIAFHICGAIIASGSIFAYLTQVKKKHNM